MEPFYCCPNAYIIYIYNAYIMPIRPSAATELVYLWFPEASQVQRVAKPLDIGPPAVEPVQEVDTLSSVKIGLKTFQFRKAYCH